MAGHCQWNADQQANGSVEGGLASFKTRAREFNGRPLARQGEPSRKQQSMKPGLRTRAAKVPAFVGYPVTYCTTIQLPFPAHCAVRGCYYSRRFAMSNG